MLILSGGMAVRSETGRKVNIHGRGSERVSFEEGRPKNLSLECEEQILQ